MSLTLAGRMDEAFKWERGDYLIKLSGDQADSLETLFDLELPTSGPFELSANVNKTDGSLRVTDIAARLQGIPQTPAIVISDGEASGGQNDLLQLALQGQFGEAPFTLRFESKQPLEDISQKTPWPIEVQLNLADLKLNIESEMIPATVAEHLEFNAQLQGETLNTLSRLLGTELPEAGPYRFSFHTRIAAGTYAVSELEGAIERLGLANDAALTDHLLNEADVAVGAPRDSPERHDHRADPGNPRRSRRQDFRTRCGAHAGHLPDRHRRNGDRGDLHLGRSPAVCGSAQGPLDTRDK